MDDSTTPKEAPVVAVAEPTPVEREMESLRQLVSRQSTLLEEFMKSQQALNQTFLEQLPTPIRGTAGRQEEEVPTTASGSGEFVCLPRATSTPERKRVREVDVDESWKEVAVSLAKRASVNTLFVKPTFHPERDHPMTFLTRFERYFRACQYPSDEKLDVVRECLGSRTSDWATLKESQWEGFDDFRRDFIERYWSEKQRHAERMNLLRKRFSGDKRLSMSEYFIQQVKSFRILTPELPEVTIVADVMRQLPSNIQSLWAVMSTKTFDGALKFLEKQQALGGDRSRPSSSGRRAVPTASLVTQRPFSGVGDPAQSSGAVSPYLVFPIPPPNFTPNNQVDRSENARGSR
ncbi:hypothetical protein RN001_002396 [Aquatica leii]|uniref:Retrotransposon gag domain-containing protein n=1 Tax=Aquatica leii TaxID=1421715 RepID=A0AAN7SSU1_9COLE|nr:hypothetical protein RN001_002396 [Aquatica leii]